MNPKAKERFKKILYEAGVSVKEDTQGKPFSIPGFVIVLTVEPETGQLVQYIQGTLPPAMVRDALRGVADRLEAANSLATNPPGVTAH